MSTTSDTGPDKSQAALSTEWLIARIVLIGGSVIAIAAIVWFGWVQPDMQRREIIAKVEQARHDYAHAAMQLCVAGLSSAKNFGIVPPYGQLYGQNMYPTNVQGRYVCIAATHATRYLIAVDLLCRNLQDSHCTSLFSVVNQHDGTVLYQRQS
ncbi:MAG: hypothetical protein ABSD74_10130 [Rhizomicrobium sp.]|jgi:hypothetical protein